MSKKRTPLTLAAYMQRAGKTQNDVAALCGISQPYVSRLLRGDRSCSLKTALRIQARTGVSIETFVTDGAA